MTITAITLAAGLAFAGASPTPPAAGDQSAATAAAQNRWDLWTGCWTLTQENTDDGSSTIARLLGLAAPRTGGPGGARVCVATDAPNTATLTTTMADRPAMSETIVADGSERPLAEAECRGWQRNEWSVRGARLFASAEISCGNQPPRKVSGVSMMIAGPTWIDIQMIESGDQRSLRVRRYRRATDTASIAAAAARRRATMALGAKLSIADVKEASAKVAPEAVQALLLELKAGFDLNGKLLLDLDRSGVSRGVIDLMVALSYPERFVVDRPVSSGGGASSWGFDSFDPSWSYYANPFLFTSYYAPFGYRYWGQYDNYYFNGPGFVNINPGTGGTPAPEASGDGRVVDGHGYTRVRRADPTPVNGFGSSGGYGTASAGGAGGSGSSGTGSSGVSSGGYSSGGGGGERTAQPRPPGR